MNRDIESETLRKVSLRLVPFLGLLYFAAFLDRVNVGFAAIQMNHDLRLSPYAYGLGAGIFFVGYCLFEVPSNLLLHRVGARRWIARIMITWSLVAAAMALATGPKSFCALRFLLGTAEAGFFPGIIYYLTRWVPAVGRARLIGAFMAAVPISTALGGPMSTALLRLDGRLGLAGWQWLFLVEALPSLVLGFATLRYLRDDPTEATWLTTEERSWLVATLDEERVRARTQRRWSVLEALTNARVLALGFCYFGAQIGLYGVILWGPQILAAAGVEAENIGWLVAVPYAVAALGMVLWSRHSDRTGERAWHMVLAALAGIAGLLTSALLPDSRVLAVLAVALAATGTLAILPIFWTMPGAMLQGAAAAAAIGLINSLGAVGGFAGPFIIGWIKSSTGSFRWGLLAAAAGLAAAGLVAFVLGRTPAVASARAKNDGPNDTGFGRRA